LAVNLMLLDEALAPRLFRRPKDLKTKLNSEAKPSCYPQVTNYVSQTSQYPQQQTEAI